MKHVFCPGDIWRQTLLKKKKKKKVDNMGPFYVTSFWAGRGTEHFNPVTLLLFSFLILNEWVSPPRCCPSRFSMKTLHTIIVTKKKKSSTWETSWSVKLEFPPFTHPFGKFCSGEWFYELNHFLALFSETQQSKCSVSPLSSIACLPCITYNAHLLNVSSCVLGEESRHLVKHVTYRCTCDSLIVHFVCVCANRFSTLH